MSNEASTDSQAESAFRRTVAVGLLETLRDRRADKTLALTAAAKVVGRELDVAEAIAALTEIAESQPTDEMGERIDSDVHTPATKVRRKVKKHMDAARSSVPTDESGRSEAALRAQSATGLIVESQPSHNFDLPDNLPGQVSKHRKKHRRKKKKENEMSDEKHIEASTHLTEDAATGTQGALGVAASLPAVQATNVTAPPNLRMAEGWPRCGNCVFFHKGCNLYGVNRPPVDSVNRGMYPTKEDQVCDSQRTVTPPEARAFSALSGAHQNLAVAESADEIVRARARVEIAEARMETALDETWSPKARAAALLARHSKGAYTDTLRKVHKNPLTNAEYPDPVVSHHIEQAMKNGHVVIGHSPDPDHSSGYHLTKAGRDAAGVVSHNPKIRRVRETAELAEVKSSAYPGLDRSPKKNWVDKAGGLPSYIERIAKHIHYEKGKDIGHAIAIAVNVVKKMCASGDTNFPGKQNVNAKSHAEACAAVAEWEAKKAKSHAKTTAKAVSESWIDGVAESGLEIAEAIIESWEPDEKFARALARCEEAFKPIPPSWNYIEAIHSEIALTEGTREWMVGMALDVSEVAEVEEGIFDAAKHGRGRGGKFRDMLSHLEGDLKGRSGKKITPTKNWKVGDVVQHGNTGVHGRIERIHGQDAHVQMSDSHGTTKLKLADLHPPAGASGQKKPAPPYRFDATDRKEMFMSPLPDPKAHDTNTSTWSAEKWDEMPDSWLRARADHGDSRASAAIVHRKGADAKGMTVAQKNVHDYLSSRSPGFHPVPPGVTNNKKTLDALVKNGHLEKKGDTYRVKSSFSSAGAGKGGASHTASAGQGRADAAAKADELRKSSGQKKPPIGGKFQPGDKVLMPSGRRATVISTAPIESPYGGSGEGHFGHIAVVRADDGEPGTWDFDHEELRPAPSGQKKPGAGDGLDDLSVDNAVGSVLSSFAGVKDWHIEPMTHDQNGKPVWKVHIHHEKGHSVAHVHSDGTVTEGGGPEHVPLAGVVPGVAAPSKFGVGDTVKTPAGTVLKITSVESNGSLKGKVVSSKNSNIPAGKEFVVAADGVSEMVSALPTPLQTMADAHKDPVGSVPDALTGVAHLNAMSKLADKGAKPNYDTAEANDEVYDALVHFDANPGDLKYGDSKTLAFIRDIAEDVNYHTVSGYADTILKNKKGPTPVKSAKPALHGYSPSDYEHTGDYNVASHMAPGTIYRGSDGVHYQHKGDAWKGKVKGYTAQNLKTGTSKFVPYFAVHGHEYEIHQPKGSGPIKTPGQAASSADDVFAKLMDSVAGNKGDANTLSSVQGKNIVVTGKIDGYTRDQIHAMISAAGGYPHKTVAMNTHVLVTGGAVGATKINAAAKKGVTVIDWEDFRHLIESLVEPDELKLALVDAQLVEATDTEEIVRLQARKGVLESRLGRDPLVRLGLEERNYSAAQRRRMAAAGQALDDGSFPIKDTEDLRNAVALLSKAKDRGKAARHIKKRAAQLGAHDMVKSI